MSSDPICPSCGLPFGLLPGCTADGAARFGVWVDVNDGPCPDCGVHPDNLHHPGCDQAVCVETGRQGLTCEHCDSFFDELLEASR
jgi:hypothetical protein